MSVLILLHSLPCIHFYYFLKIMLIWVHRLILCCFKFLFSSVAGAVWQRGPKREGFSEDHSAPHIWKVPGAASLHQEADQQHFFTVSKQQLRVRTKDLCAFTLPEGEKQRLRNSSNNLEWAAVVNKTRGWRRLLTRRPQMFSTQACWFRLLLPCNGGGCSWCHFQQARWQNGAPTLTICHLE